MLTITTHQENDVTIVEMSGAIGNRACRQFKETFDQLIEAGHYKIIVDLTRVDYMTAVGAGIFMAVHTVAEEHKGNIILVHPTQAINEIFRLIGLKKIVRVMPDKEAALCKLAENHIIASPN